jgi:SPP1 family predicted phage head-tail adaptor
MASSRGGGDLRHRVAFEKRASGEDGYGNTVEDWREQFVVSAGYQHLRGGEGVMAGRLSGEHTQVIFVRASSQTRAVAADWRARDVRAGTIFNIREITESEDRAWLDFLCQSGVAS